MSKKSLLQIQFLLLTVIVAANLTCDDCPEGLTYYLPVSLSPQRDSFNVGDSLFLSINIPKKLTDELGGIENTFENFDFKLGARTARFDSAHEYSTQTIEVYSQIGSDTVYSYGFFDEYGLMPNYDGETYKYQAVLTMKESGVFAIYFGTRYDSKFDPIRLTGKCKGEAVNMYCITNNGQNNNVELVSPYNGNSTFWENQFKLSGGYAFVVRE